MNIVGGNPSGNRPSGGSSFQPVPYQRGPPQDYMEAVTNKRLLEEVLELF